MYKHADIHYEPQHPMLKSFEPSAAGFSAMTLGKFRLQQKIIKTSKVLRFAWHAAVDSFYNKDYESSGSTCILDTKSGKINPYSYAIYKAFLEYKNKEVAAMENLIPTLKKLAADGAFKNLLNKRKWNRKGKKVWDTDEWTYPDQHPCRYKHMGCVFLAKALMMAGIEEEELQ